MQERGRTYGQSRCSMRSRDTSRSSGSLIMEGGNTDVLIIVTKRYALKNWLSLVFNGQMEPRWVQADLCIVIIARLTIGPNHGQTYRSYSWTDRS